MFQKVFRLAGVVVVFVFLFTMQPVGCGIAGELQADEPNATPKNWAIAERIDVSPVWSGHRVGFCLLSDGDRQYAAYYDADRNLVVASRLLDSDQWEYKVLPTKIGWDSHNYVTMVVDGAGNLHVSGNMHCVPLIYFRTTKPGDISTLAQFKSMVGTEESRCTYPRFVFDADRRLLYTYRDGSSGNGSQIWNVYDEKTETWSRLLDTPLFDGRGLMNAYFVGPERDADGVFHVCWVWRDTPDCSTNHDLSYARSRDLVHWEKSDGTPLKLPITLETGDVVDPVPAKGGIINGNTKIGFDADGRVILSYHKYDENGHTQIYNARLEEGGWKIYQTSDWDYRWEFSGGGTIGFSVGVGPVSLDENGNLVQSFSNPKNGSGNWVLDPETLKVVGRAPASAHMPREIGQRISDHPLIQVRTTGDIGPRYSDAAAEGPDDVRYLLRWEALPSNRDRPFEGEIPAPSMLRLYKLVLE